MALRATTSLDGFLRAPLDAYVIRESFAFWQSGREANGLIAWGTPDERGVREMMRAFDVVLGPHVREHVSLVDVRGLERIEPHAFTDLLAFMTKRRAAYAECTRKQALVCKKTPLGAGIIGLYHMMQPAYPTQVFYDIGPAIEWLVEGGPDARKVHRAFAQTHEHVTSSPPLLSRVRAAMGEDVPSMRALAAVLSTSVRTLQRQLRQVGTTFRDEHLRARVERAKVLLRDTDLTVSAVAGRAGFASASAFVSAFRRATGRTPGQFRGDARDS